MSRHNGDRGAAWRSGAPAVVAAAALTGTLLAGCASAPTVRAPAAPEPPSASEPTAPSESTEPPAPSNPASSPSSASPSGTTATVPPRALPGGASPVACRSGGLSVTLGTSEGAAGTVYVPLRFTNLDNQTCVLRGFPGVSYVAGDVGDQVGPAAEHDGVAGSPVTLAPGAVASAMLAMVQVRNYDEAACRPVPTRGLRVYPPGETASLYVPVDGTGCSGNPPGPQLRVATLKAGLGQG